MVEVANSLSYESVLNKFERWFVASEGMVEVALLLKFTETDPLINPACFLEVYRSCAASDGADHVGAGVNDNRVTNSDTDNDDSSQASSMRGVSVGITRHGGSVGGGDDVDDGDCLDGEDPAADTFDAGTLLG